MPWDQKALMKARGIVYVVAGVLVVVVYVITRLR
jgi:hypothetical protein